MPKLKNLNPEQIAVKAAIAVKDGAEFALDRASNGKQLIEDKINTQLKIIVNGSDHRGD